MGLHAMREGVQPKLKYLLLSHNTLGPILPLEFIQTWADLETGQAQRQWGSKNRRVILFTYKMQIVLQLPPIQNKLKDMKPPEVHQEEFLDSACTMLSQW